MQTTTMTISFFGHPKPRGSSEKREASVMAILSLSPLILTSNNTKKHRQKPTIKMSATMLSSPPRGIHPPYWNWAETTLQIPSLATAAFLNFSAFERNYIMESKETPRSGDMQLILPSKDRWFGKLHVDGLASIVGKVRPGQVEADEGEKHTIPEHKLKHMLSDMIIVVPCKDETLEIIEEVISHIPEGCLVILVSNCTRRGEEDEYVKQMAMVKKFGRSGRQIMVMHQKNLTAAAAFRESGMSDSLFAPDGTIRNGKGEGMLLATALAKILCPERRYIGFVDADNNRPDESIAQYCNAYAAGFAMNPSPEKEETMVRIRWASKPKKENGQVKYVEEGRCSRIVNAWLNRLFDPASNQQIPSASKDQQDNNNNNNNNNNKGGKPAPNTPNPFITTGNAGEHAMTMDLALKLRMAAGYAIEPYHFIDLLERAHLKPDAGNSPTALDKTVRVYQIRTTVPHHHRGSNDDHIRKMWAAGLGSVYHGLEAYGNKSVSGEDGKGMCDIGTFRKEVKKFVAENEGDEEGEPPRPKVYPALGTINWDVFREVMKGAFKDGSLVVCGVKGVGEV